MRIIRELTVREKQSIARLARGKCANFYESEDFTGCLPLDCDCPMLSKAFCGNAMCRYFREAVLPNDPELAAIMAGGEVKRCKYCGRYFPADGRRQYCSVTCSSAAARLKTAARVRKHRAKGAAV